MKFINNDEAVQVRISEKYGYTWTLLYHGEVIDLPEDVGVSYGFDKVTEGKIGKTPVETKQIEKPKSVREVVDDVKFFRKLISIKGIGQYTAEDIIKIYGTEEELIKHINHDDELPLRADAERKLRKFYRGKK